MRILVTNDDGVDAPGLAALVAGLATTGHEILVVAPREDCSGAGGAIGPIRIPHHLEMERRALAAVPDVEAYGLATYPAMCVLTAMLGGFGEKPDLIISGINAGPNIGRSIFHSGTVAAALTGAMYGARGLAVSLSAVEGTQWDTAVATALASLDWLLDAPPSTVININVPDLPLNELRGFHRASLAPLGQLRTSMVDEAGELKVKLTLGRGTDPEGSDAALVRLGYATFTSLAGVGAAADGHAEDLVRRLNGENSAG